MIKECPSALLTEISAISLLIIVRSLPRGKGPDRSIQSSQDSETWNSPLLSSDTGVPHQCEGGLSCVHVTVTSSVNVAIHRTGHTYYVPAGFLNLFAEAFWAGLT